MLNKTITPKEKIILGGIALFLMISFYFYLSYRQHKLNPNDTTIPNINQLYQGFKSVILPDKYGNIRLLTDVLSTGERLIIGFSFGIILSVILGILAGCFPYFASIIMPPINFLSYPPPTAMLSLFLVCFGTGMELFIAMISFGIIPPMVKTIYQSIKYDIPEELIYKTYTLGGSKAEIIIELVFKIILPRLIESIRLQVGPAMIFLIAAETLFSG